MLVYLRRLFIEIWKNPIMTTVRIFALFISLQVVLDLIGDLFGIDALDFFSGWTEMLFSLLLAFILIKIDVGKIAVGVFLFIVFVLSITFFIVPIQSMLNEVVRTVQPEYYKQETLDPRLETISEALNTADRFFPDSLNRMDSYEGYIKWSIENGKQSFNEIERELDFVINDQKPDKEQDLFYKVLNRIVYNLYDNAAFIFTLIMGALGSSIAISQKFIKDYESER